MADAPRRLTVGCVKAERLNSFGKLPTSDQPLTIRVAAPEDAGALRRLAELDSAAPLTGDVLIAELDGAAIAAASLEGGRVIADPFTPSAYAVRMLTVRRYQMIRQGRQGTAVRFRHPRRVPDPLLVVRRGEA
jgi:hypothetical protein